MVVPNLELPTLAAISDREADSVVPSNERRAHSQRIEPRKDAAGKIQLPALGPIRIVISPAVQPDPAAECNIPGRTELVVLVPKASEPRLLPACHVGFVDDPLRHNLARPGLRIVARRRIDMPSSGGGWRVQVERLRL